MPGTKFVATYYPTPDAVIDRMLRVAQISAKDTVRHARWARSGKRCSLLLLLLLGAGCCCCWLAAAVSCLKDGCFEGCIRIRL